MIPILNSNVNVSAVRCWVRQFKSREVGHLDLGDKPQSGRAVTKSGHIKLHSGTDPQKLLLQAKRYCCYIRDF